MVQFVIGIWYDKKIEKINNLCVTLIFYSFLDAQIMNF